MRNRYGTYHTWQQEQAGVYSTRLSCGKQITIWRGDLLEDGDPSTEWWIQEGNDWTDVLNSLTQCLNLNFECSRCKK